MNKIRKWDKTNIINTTHYNKKRIQELTADLIKFYSDPDKKIRTQQKVECKYCYYVYHYRIGGAAMTNVLCRICEKEMLFPSTCIDVLCKECAVEHKLCSHCGAKLD